MKATVLILAGITVAGYAIICAVLLHYQRTVLYFPTHQRAADSMLTPWTDGTQVIGYCREVPHPANVWLMMHGNAGQAEQRQYALRCMSPVDSLYVLEYPGYATRAGRISRESFNQAATQAYQLLRRRFPATPVGVVGESIGSGPACALAEQAQPPDKIVLIVPFDTLANVAAEKFRLFPVRWLLQDKWDNVEALRGYRGKVEIFAAQDDRVIPNPYARRLAEQVSGSVFHLIPGGHNDWSDQREVMIRNP
jgi:pimeloyl-ACP methyl ester carboxylesterase